jgi:hypothetical protein
MITTTKGITDSAGRAMTADKQWSFKIQWGIVFTINLIIKND